MTEQKFHSLPFGAYRVRWKSGGVSYGVIGQLYDGTHFLACANWTAPTVGGVATAKGSIVRNIKSVIRLR